MFLENTFNQEEKFGWIEVICGSMFSGKTEELIRRLRRAVIARQRVQIFKPGMDTQQVIARFEAERQALALTGAGYVIWDWDATPSRTTGSAPRSPPPCAPTTTSSLRASSSRPSITRAPATGSPRPMLYSERYRVDLLDPVVLRCPALGHVGQQAASQVSGPRKTLDVARNDRIDFDPLASRPGL